jgi:LuxR family maltose regulon positive regulatory protein
MPKILFSTKLNVPPPGQTIVFRTELMATLAKARTYRLTLVSAPPGYGKTTLVSSWLVETKLPSTWLSLDEGDNDPIRFLE